MRVLFHQHGGEARPWLEALSEALPEAALREWSPGDEAPADYALVWRPPADLLRGRKGLKAVFNLGAGVDAVLAFLNAHPDMLPHGVPLIRLEDGGMAAQMSHYVCSAVLRHLRDFDDYRSRQADACWQPLPPRDPAAYRVGVLGAGVLGAKAARALARLGLSVRVWRRGGEGMEGVETFCGRDQLADFAGRLDAVVNLLPLTEETADILDARLFGQLARGALVVNVARGGHLVEADLLTALDGGQVGHAVLDVFRHEPLPPDHAFWRHPGITITPHVAAVTLIGPSVRQIADKIRQLERGERVTGVVSRSRGY